MIGDSPSFKAMRSTMVRVARADASVLLLGETGTGKEVAARFIHLNSKRSKAPFIDVDLAALPEALLESELFGHEAEAFTGATKMRRGRIELAHEGTLFIDEIGNLPMALQPKLLRVLQEKTYERLGSSEKRVSKFRLIAATNLNLEEAVAAGTFRQDLLFRINTVQFEIPPLRQRLNDILALAEHFLEVYAREAGITGIELLEEARRALLAHPWPGNVRELKHLMERTVALSENGTKWGAEILSSREQRKPFQIEVDEGLTEGRGLDEILRGIERRILLTVLRECQGNHSAAARKLKLPRQTLQNRLSKYDLL
ncbi:MAG: sigma-54 interaction domain-containing protein [Myxococcaceae bacterium]